MKLPDAAYSAYWDKGWAVVAGVFDSDEIDPIARLAMAHAINEIEGGKGDDSELESAAEGRAIPRKINHPFLKSDHFRRFVLNAGLRELLAMVVGKPVLLAADQIFLKPPKHGSAKPYHRDNAYFRCHPADEVITAWIALDDADEENGCLRYIDGSHRLPILEHHEVAGETYNLQPAESEIDRSRESVAAVPKGGVVLHHSKTLHTSGRNNSDRWRRAYATHWVTGDVTSEVETLQRAYFSSCPEDYAEALEA
jgi:ectoine hydroxylase-related dioxygenase (phytanoyl-CoA dioxygenase family)